MLELKNIKKVYGTPSEKVEALKGVSIKFRESEFVSILGQSGCGKTTLLNIIGGLDRYTSGDLIINGKSTKKFQDRDWDAYRNYKVGFVFQSYNLISHQTILSNVELALTIGGVSKKERKERAIKALEDVGLKNHIHKKPNQLSGGQMQRVAIARALVNDPDIILADEPTGALDTKTSVQVMEILKQISKDKLIIMVTHNPELAEKYSSRILKILDGVITEDSNPISEEEVIEEKDTSKIGRTSMKLLTAFRLSLNNLLTKKGRTVLVAFAGSIGIIGIALVLSVSNGFQAYVDHIQEETLTSYPLTIMQETTDVASALLSLTSTEKNEDSEGTELKEEQYISKMLATLSTNDLKSFKKHLENNYKEVENDLSSVKYSYSVEPMIYTIDATKEIVKLNPSNLFNSPYGSSMGMSFGSTYSQMTEDYETLNNSYDILAGSWPQKYNEMVIVLAERNTISDFLVYTLGLRDTKELSDIVSKIMNGETVEINNEPMKITYDDLLNLDLRLVMPTEVYKYNEQYDIYEDMSEDKEYIRNLYDNSVKLKISGIVALKDGVTSAALNPGVSYTSDLIKYIIDYSANTEMVKKQLANENVDILSGNDFDAPKSSLGLDFTDLVSIDTENLQNAFNINIDQNDIQQETEGYMGEIANSISTDITPAKNDFSNTLNTLANGMFDSIAGEITSDDVETIVADYLEREDVSNNLENMENTYVIPKDTYKTAYAGILKGLLQVYISSYYAANTVINQSAENINNIPIENDDDKSTESIEQFKNIIKQNPEILNSYISEHQEEIAGLIEDNTGDVLSAIQENPELLQSIFDENAGDLSTFLPQNVTPGIAGETGIIMENAEQNESDSVPTAVIDRNILNPVQSAYLNSVAIQQTEDTMARVMTEAVMKKNVLTKVAELTGNLTSSFASAFNVDEDKIANSFQMKLTEDEITRIITAMLTQTEKNAKSNLVNFGYQDLEEPTFISFYFKSFDGKEHFKDFINKYNENLSDLEKDDKEINYTDTTGILMGSVKTIVNAVTYVLIAFVSISLVVSSIMIGIITYISVYERTKEIGILRAIGASKRNISSIFNAETFIIGLLSGLFGIGTTYALIPIINKVLHHFTGNVPLNATFYISNAIVLIILSIILTLIGGLIPARAASKKDPVIALRTE